MAMKNHKKTYRWIFLAVFVVALLFLLATLLYGVYLYYYSKINYQAAQEETFVIQPKEDEIRVDTEPQTTAFVPDEDWEYSSETVRNILLIGVDNDNREGMQSRGNADGLILLSINEKTKQVILTSLMRDIDVLLPEGYHTKITLSYYFRGIPGLIEVVERNFNVPIDNYVLVNYLNLIDIVDAFGGVTLDVTQDELIWMEEKIENLNILTGQPAGSNLISPTRAGELTLNGIQTAAYLRIRYAGNGDFDRTARARHVLTELKNKARKMSAGEWNRMINVILPCIQTDLSQSDILTLAFNTRNYLKYNMISQRIPIEGSYQIMDMIGSEVVLDYQLNNEYLYYTIYEGYEPPTAG